MVRAGTDQSRLRLLMILLSVILALIGLVIITTAAGSNPNRSEYHSTLCGTLSGVINSNTVLVEDCTYDVTGNVLVDATAILTINPGVILNFTGAYFIHVTGSLNALGTSDKQILITSDDSNDSNFALPEIRLLGNEKSIMSHVIMELKSTSESWVVPISAWNGPHLLDHITIKSPDFGGYSSPDTVVGLGSNQTLQNSHFSDISAQIVLLVHDNSSAGTSTKILSNTFSWNHGNILGNWGVSAPLNFSNNRVIHNEGARVEFGQVNVTVTNNSFAHNYNLSIGGFSGLVECNLFRDTKFGLGDYITFENNNIYQPNGVVSMFVGTAPPPTLTAENNYWGTVNVSQIDALIWDYNDDFFLSSVDYTPFLNNPAPCAPVESSLIAYLPSLQK